MISIASKKLHRLPATGSYKTSYEILAKSLATAEGDDAALKAVARALLLSPLFLYRSELGAPVSGKANMRRFDSFEVASALSFALWQSSPDDRLLDLAAAGKLDTLTALEAEAKRMVLDVKFERFISKLLLDLTRSNRMNEHGALDGMPNSKDVIRSYESEMREFIKTVLTHNGTFSELISLPFISSDAGLLKIRQMDGKAIPEIAGLLGLGAINFANSTSDLSSPVRRGLVVRERLLCSPVPPPPDKIDTDLIKNSTQSKTTRDRFEATTMSQAQCAACHKNFNGFGYSMESFDNYGRYRKGKEGDQPLNLEGKIEGIRSETFEFSNQAKLSEQLAESKIAKTCFVLNSYRFIAGRIENKGDRCFVKSLVDKIDFAKVDLRDVAVKIISSESILYRTGE